MAVEFVPPGQTRLLRKFCYTSCHSGQYLRQACSELVNMMSQNNPLLALPFLISLLRLGLGV
jgi:hypothetical protein